MKKIVLAFACLLISSGSFAQVRSGAIVNHRMSCSTPTNDEGNSILGVGYKLNCFTRAVAPENSLYGCELSRTAVYPGAKPEKIKLTMKKQTANNAKLESADGNTQVRVHKNDLSAIVIFSDATEMECSAAQ